MKKIIFITILFLCPMGVFAKGSWNLVENRNTLLITGACFDKQVKIDLYEKNKGEAVYTSGAMCKDGKFEFSDNLLQWKSLKDGEYELLVNDDESNVGKVFIARPVEKPAAQVEKSAVATQSVEASVIEDVPVDPETKFLGAFVSLQQSILDMREWLDQTSYPKVLKSSIGLGLDGMDLAVGKVSDLVLSFQETGNVTVEKAPEKTVETPVVVTSDVVAEPIAVENLVKLESVIVSDVSEVENAPIIDVTDSALTVDSTTIAQ
ncbi:MAG: hypothetical protein Q7T51_04905 [Candidatus Moranbacteria bacterium]|nr:hypothetical protein [Candidatus Moranbacteria bacterium]